jgi:PKD repeat protein
MKKVLSLLLVGILLLASGCDMMGDLKDIVSGIHVGADINVDTTSDLGQDTLDRIDDINDTIATGLEVGPETREVIEELNETIANGLKAGFDDDTLSRVDELLRVVEDGLKIGLDDETLTTIDGMVDTIDRMPGNWEASAQDIINTLENTAGSTAARLADEVKGVMQEARLNYQQMTALTGVEFRCNVDFLGSKVGATAQEFIGKSIVGKLKNIISGKPIEQTVPIPWVCQVIPDSLTLSKVGEQLIFPAGVITLTGYNYVFENVPTAQIVDESGMPVPGIALYPYLSSPYQIQLNLQQLDFSMVPPRSRVVFTWPNANETSGIAILMPDFAGPMASFTMDKTSGQAPLTVQFTDTSAGSPTEWLWVFGDGSTSHEQNPVHTYNTSRDFQVQLTVKNALGQSSVIQILSVGTALEADFSVSQTSGEVGLMVQFKDKSKGGPTSWLWDFGDGTEPSTEQDPTHVYMNANPEGFVVTLNVSRGSATATKTSTNRIKVLEPLEARIGANRLTGVAPLEIAFSDESVGGSGIISRLWDFGDDTTSTEKNPSHTYPDIGEYTVTLKVTRADAKTDEATVTVKSYEKLSYLNRRLLPAFMLNSLKDNTIYFTSFDNIEGGTVKNTNISSTKYVCGVAGFSATYGVMYPYRMNADGLKIYMYPDQGKWMLFTEFQDVEHSYFSKERWKVDVVCYSREIEDSVFLYRDDFRSISGGTAKNTDISTETYFNCGVMGVAGLGVTGFRHGWYSEVALDQTLDGSGNNWKINTDMDVIDGGDIWNVNVLCLKHVVSFFNTEVPGFKTPTVYISTSISNFKSTDISATDYVCGVNGYKAERTDLYAADPVWILDNRNIAPELLSVYAKVVNGYWGVWANIANRVKNEDWTVNLLCVRRGVAVEGMPPN